MTEIPGAAYAPPASPSPSQPKTPYETRKSSRHANFSQSFNIAKNGEFGRRIRQYRKARIKAGEGDPDSIAIMSIPGRCVLASSNDDFIMELPKGLRKVYKRAIREYMMWLFKELIHGREVNLPGLMRISHKFWVSRGNRFGFDGKATQIPARWGIRLKQNQRLVKEFIKLATRVSPDEKKKMPENPALL